MNNATVRHANGITRAFREQAETGLEDRPHGRKKASRSVPGGLMTEQRRRGQRAVVPAGAVGAGAADEMALVVAGTGGRIMPVR